MPILLHIETSNTVCSVCLSIDGKVAALRENTEGNQHAVVLTPFIQQVLDESGIAIQNIDAVVLSAGPGSYTGLRIGASAAKAICYATGKPLISVGTLQAMAAGYINAHGQPTADTVFCPMVDARRMEVYAALYNHQLEEIKPPQPWIIEGDEFFGEYTAINKVICLGNGVAKAVHLLGNKAIIAENEYFYSAINMISFAEKKYTNSAFEDIAYFEPKYLKTTALV